MRTDKADLVFRRGLLECPREGKGADHAGGARVGVLPVHGKHHQARPHVFDAAHRLFERQILGIAIENADAKIPGAAGLGQQQPGRRLDGRINGGGPLVGLCG